MRVEEVRGVHRACDETIRLLKQENGAQRIRIRTLELELVAQKAAAATANGIAAQVFEAIRAAMGGRNTGMAGEDLAVRT